MSYVDTSVIVSALDRLDPRQKIAREILEKEVDKKISELVLVELASILSRREGVLSDLSKRMKVREELVLPAAVLYIMKRFKLSYERVDGYKRAVVGNIYFPFGIALELSSELKLKTLDLLHLAYIRALTEQGEEINTLLTLDEDFEKEKERIERELNVKVKVLKAESGSR